MRAVWLVLVMPLLSGCLLHDQRFDDPTKLAFGDLDPPDDCPGDWHVGIHIALDGRVRELSPVSGDAVSLVGRTMHLHGGCITTQEALAAIGVNLSVEGLTVDARHGRASGDHGEVVVAVQLWQDERLIVINGLRGYLDIQPHDGSRILLAPKADAVGLLGVARQFEDFRAADEPTSPPSGGLRE